MMPVMATSTGVMLRSITKQDSEGTVIKMRHNLVLNSRSSTTQLIQQLHMGRQLFDYLQ